MTTIAIPSRTDAIRERLAERRLPPFATPVPEPAVAPVAFDPTAGIPVLVVDDEQTIRETCAILLRHEGYDVTTCSRGQEAIELLSKRTFPIIVVDLHLPHIDGLAVLRAAREASEETLVIMMTGRPSVESSVTALEHGAWEYLPKPFSATQLQILVGRAAHAVRTRGGAQAQLRTEDGSSSPEFLGTSPAFRAMIDLAKKVAATDASVFVTGESGSGKELIARFIHERSHRAHGAFVPVNCAALPEQLLESEMFGHRKGAFTDAVRDKAGLMETANGGTLFLDELLEMSKAIQAKLLRVIQDGVVRRVGSESDDATVDVRFVVATNRSPEEAVENAQFREDLLYRLRVVPIHVPPLRERRDDIPLLAKHFLEMYWARHRANGTPAPEFTDAAIQALTQHQWPGNVRELQNVVEHAVVLADTSPTIDVGALLLTNETPAPSLSASSFSLSPVTADEGYHAARDRTIAEFELRYVQALLERANGNMSRAARIAGMDRATLYRLVERHDLQRGSGVGNAWLVERITRDAKSAVSAVDATNFGAF